MTVEMTNSHDLAGRRTVAGGSFARSGLPASLANASYNANNQQTQFGAASLTYDANGNLTSDSKNTYTWNARNQLVAIGGSVAANFQYDAFGRRVSKTIGGTMQYLYDGANPVEELSGETVTASLLAGGIDEYFQRTDSSGPRSFLTDALGSTVALADSAGALATQYTYEPFGNTTSSGAATANSFAFTGRELDATGLYFFRARYYSTTLQRFVSEDPARFAAGDTNLYGYMSNGPVDGRDSLGLWDKETHDKLIWIALKPCGLSDDEINKIQQANNKFDARFAGQMPWNSYQHSMVGLGQSETSATNERNEFVRESLGLAIAYYDQGGDWETPFAKAIHPLMDLTSPAHTGKNGEPLTWITPWNFYKHGLPFDPFTIEDWAHMTPAILKANVAMIQDAYRLLVGRKSACSQ